MPLIEPLPTSGIPTLSLVTLQSGHSDSTVESNLLDVPARYGKSLTLTDKTLPLAPESAMTQLARISPFSSAYAVLAGLAMIVSSMGTSPVNDGIRGTPAAR